MWRTLLLLSLGVVGPTLGRDIPGVRSTEEYERAEILDKRGNFVLFWNYNETHVTFETHVKTTGWVGFGLSGNGAMYPGDVVIGWVSADGSAHLSDRHTVGHSPPVPDASQDWQLLYGEENEFGTVLKFVRRIDTCNADGDIIIPSGTTHAIYAYGSADPTGGSDVITYHGTSRGTKSLAILTSSHAPANMPSDLKYYDFLNQNHILSDEVSSYGCQYFQMPDLGGKHHMIKYEPLITPGNEENVHHIILYRCKGLTVDDVNVVGGTFTEYPTYEPLITPGNEENVHHIILYRCKGLTVDDVKDVEGAGGKCYSNTYCNDGVIGWGIGGESFYFPEHIGFSIGAPEDATLYIMETHYHNSAHKTGAFDNSGLRMTLTSTLRPQEAGLLSVGVPPNPHHVIPPRQEAFLTKGYCSESCIRDAMTDSNLSEIKIIAAIHHSHALAVSMTTRHFRNGTELEPILSDPNYNTEFEEIHLLPKERSVYPGDSLRMDCTYDSSDRSGPTFGGLSIENEMCLTSLYYYPTMHLLLCDSQNLYDAFNLNSDGGLSIENEMCLTSLYYYPTMHLLLCDSQNLYDAFNLNSDGGLSIENEMCLTSLYYYPTMHLLLCDSQNLYDAFNLNSNGGLSIENEMCLTSLYYYPTMHLLLCDSQNLYDAFDLNSDFAKYQYLLSVDWSNKTQAAQFEQTMQQSRVTHFCFGSRFTLADNNHQIFVEKDDQTPYNPELFADNYPQKFVEKDEQTPYTPPPADCP